MFMALLTEEDSGHMPPTSAATSLNGINKSRARQQQTRAAGILPISTLLASRTEVFLPESKHASH